MAFNSLLIRKTVDVGLGLGLIHFLCICFIMFGASVQVGYFGLHMATWGFALNPFAENPPKTPGYQRKVSNSVNKPFADRKPQ